MSKKLCKKHSKIVKKVFQNGCQNLQKTFKKLDAKKESIFRGSTRNPGSPRESHKHYKSTRHIRPVKKDTYREAHAERPT